MASKSRRLGPGLIIGIDARAATEEKAGRGRVVRELIKALATRDDPHGYRCYARRAWDGPLDSRFSWSLNHAPDPIWHARAAVAANRECDVFLSTNSYLTVLMLRVPSVVAVHDLLAFDRDMQPNRRSAVIERLTLRPAARRAHTLWCVSDATAAALVRRLPFTETKLAVIPLAASSEFAAAAVEAPALSEAGTGSLASGFVLAVGTLEPRKNLPRLVSAYASLPVELQAQHPLVVVGAEGWRTGETLAALKSLGERARLLGHVSDAELVRLYRRCDVFCYPSLGEGFGLPVLEAMAAGAPVLTSNATSLPEVGGEAVEYVDPWSVESIAAGLTRLLGSANRRAELAELARARAREFSWATTAGRVLRLLERAAGRES